MEGVIEKLVAILIMSEVVMVIVQNLKRVSDRHTSLVALAVGVAVSVVAQAELLAYLGFEVRSALADQVITGLAASAGASLVHEALKKWGLDVMTSRPERD